MKTQHLYEHKQLEDQIVALNAALEKHKEEMENNVEINEVLEASISKVDEVDKDVSCVLLYTPNQNLCIITQRIVV